MCRTPYFLELDGKAVNKKKSRKCKKRGIKNSLFILHIQAKCGDIANKNPNATDNDEPTFNYGWPSSSLLLIGLASFGQLVSFDPQKIVFQKVSLYWVYDRVFSIN